MRVPEHAVLNALFLAPGVSGGPETYLRGLAPALAAEFPDLRLTIVTTTSGAAFLREIGFGDFASVRALPCEDGQRLRRTVAEQIMLPRVARDAGGDLIHSLASTAPLWPRMPSVITLHDVTFLHVPTFGAVTTIGMGVVVAAATRHADVLLTGTAAARDEVCSTLGIDPARFIVVHHGHGRRSAAKPVPEAEVRDRLALSGARVVLCVGAKRPHKNQGLLVEAANQLDDDVVIVLVGHPEPYEQTLRALTTQLGVADRIRIVDPVSDSELEALWAIAGCFAFPTLGEGFGLPLLEAMDHDVVVACSDLPVLREIGGDAPVFFDPHSPSDAARAIRVALAEPERAERGRRQAALFTWERAAQGTYAAYERALARAA